MTQKLSLTDVAGLGFMTFAFFLGAGNIIFPPTAGAQAGEALTPAILGFLATGVGLPLLTLVAVAKAGGGVRTMARYLPASIATTLALAIFIIIGPSFATPRTALVAYEIGFVPFIGGESTLKLAVFSIAFFAIVALLAIKPGKLLDYIGKFISPLLILLLLGLAVAVFIWPQGETGEALQNYQSHPFIQGVLEGYNTMDTFGALVFGMLIVNVLVNKGVEDKSAQFKYLVIAGTIAAAGLAIVYIALFYLGATSGEVAPGGGKGTVILTAYVYSMLGNPGLWVLAIVVSIACLTTAVGLVSAMSGFLLRLKPEWDYKTLTLLNCAICALVTNIGLSQLIALSVPVLYGVYPIAIALVLLTMVKDMLGNKVMAYRFVLAVATLFGLLDGLKGAGVDMSLFNFIPLFDKGMAWVLPTAAALVISLIVFRQGNTDDTPEIATEQG